MTPAATATPTARITPTPGISFTPTVPPAVELLDVTIGVSHYGQTILMGKIRNNTNQLIYLATDWTDRNPVYAIKIDYFEGWIFNSYDKKYEEVIWKHPVLSGGAYSFWPTTKLLYPGETGIMAYTLKPDECNGCFIQEDSSQEKPSKWLDTLEYTSTVLPAKESEYSPACHPKAENVRYLFRDGLFILRFDATIKQPDVDELTIGAALFNQNNEVIDVFTSENWPYSISDGTLTGKHIYVIGGGRNDIVGRGVASDPYADFDSPYISSVVDLDMDLIHQVDHVEVFLEVPIGSCA